MGHQATVGCRCGIECECSWLVQHQSRTVQVFPLAIKHFLIVILPTIATVSDREFSQNCSVTLSDSAQQVLEVAHYAASLFDAARDILGCLLGPVELSVAKKTSFKIDTLKSRIVFFSFLLSFISL